MFLQNLQCAIREADGAVAVGLEVDTNVKLLSSVVQVLYSSGDTFYRESLAGFLESSIYKTK